MRSNRAGRYTLLEQVGFRRKAELWRARETGEDSSENVLIERLPAEHAQGEVGQRFIRRAQRGLAVQHRNVTAVYEVGTTDAGDVFVVREWVDGPSLLRLLAEANRKNDRLPVWLPLYVGECIVEALRFAARSTPNLAHGDVRSRHVFVTFEGIVKLVDFGVDGRATRGPYDAQRDRLEQAGYRAPEHELDDAGVTASFDQYALAVILWEALTQRRLYAGPTLESVQRRVAGGPDRPPSALRPGVSEAVDALVMEALDPNLARRPASLDDFGQRIITVRVKEERVAGPLMLAHFVRDLLGSSGRAPPGPRAAADTIPDAPLPFVDPTVLPDRTSEFRALRDLWEPAEGSRVFLRGPGRVSRGPRTPLEVLRLLTELTVLGVPSSIEVSVDRARWISAAEVARLLGEASVDVGAPLPTGEVAGSIRDDFVGDSAARAFAEVARTGCSGRLVFVRRAAPANLRYEFDVDAGRLTACTSNRHLLFGLRALPFDGLVPAEFGLALGRMLRLQRPFADICAPTAMEWVTEIRGRGLRRSVIEVLGWEEARFAFEVGATSIVGRAEPISILRALPAALEVAQEVKILVERLRPLLNVPMKRTPRFRHEPPDAGLSIEDTHRLARLGEGRTLQDSWAMSNSLRDERALVRLSYLAVQLEWVVPER